MNSTTHNISQFNRSSYEHAEKLKKLICDVTLNADASVNSEKLLKMRDAISKFDENKRAIDFVPKVNKRFYF
jgi:hypothetical protein